MILGAGIGAGILLVVLFVLAAYKKCPPDMAYIISGMSKEPRYLIGKAGFVIPFFERYDKLTLELIQLDVRVNSVPTNDFIDVNVDAVANVRISKEDAVLKLAARHFLNTTADKIGLKANEVLQGNMREIIGQMELKEVVIDKKKFSEKIQENAIDDIKAMGLEIVSLNVQNCNDDQDAIKNLGIDNLVKIQKDAAISRAKSEREVAVEKAKAEEEANKERVMADTKIAEQNKDLDVKRAEFKKLADIESAKADAAKGIEAQIQQKTVNERAMEAETAKAEKQVELKEREIILKERELDALVRKQADADKYAVEVRAQADKLQRIAIAEAELAESQKEAEAKIALAKAAKESAVLEAEGIKAKGEAEAASIKAKLLAEAEGIKQAGLAEAEAIDKKAEAMKKMESAAVIEMITKVLPEVAREVNAPLGTIDNITMYSGGEKDFLGSTTQGIDKTMNIFKDSMGLDVKSLVAGFLGGKVLGKDGKVDVSEDLIKKIAEKASEGAVDKVVEEVAHSVVNTDKSIKGIPKKK